MRTIVFDLDDTLYREWDFIRGGYKAVALYMAGLHHESPTSVYRKLLQIYSVHGRDNTLRRLIRELRSEERCDVMSLVDIYRRHNPKLALFDDAKDILTHLKTRKYRIGMITDGLYAVQKSKVRALDIERYFSSIIYTHELGVNYYKPHPLPYSTMAKNLGCAYSDMVYVGDNPHKDFVTAKKLGIITVRMMRGSFAQVTVDDEYDAHMHMDSFRGFGEWLQNGVLP